MKLVKLDCIPWVIVGLLFSDPSFCQSADSVSYYTNSRNQIGLPTNQAILLEGRQLFNTHCSSCHSLCQQRMGPPLAGATDRRPIAWLFDFISSSQKVIQSGDPYGKFLYQQYNYAIMPDFNFLSQEKVLAILGYIDAASSAPTHVAGVNGRPLQGAQNLQQLEELPLQSTVTAIEYEEEGATRSTFLILKIVIFAVAVLSVVVHIFYVTRLWKKGKTKFKI